MSPSPEYTELTRRYQGRHDPYLGRKLSTIVWLSHDPIKDRFTLSEVMKCYGDFPGTNRTRKLPRKDWIMAPFAFVDRRTTIITRNATNSVLRFLKVYSYKFNQKTVIGREWCYGLQKLVAEAPIMLENHRLSPILPVKKRVAHKEKVKEIRELLQAVGRKLIARAKLGAFVNVLPSVVDIVGRQHGYKFEILGNGQLLLKLLLSVDDERLESFYPILWLCDPIMSYIDGSTRGFGERDWVSYYKKFANAVREKLYLATGAVEYV